ncbi:bifunctional adenosylcobinamide kinase/adenosylcobinamide-phosphate guanylyltransferase [Aliamphritea ceti]|uniref:bifunctional adenosylcobinamide kinase/adenosylcobinamide-phosphate guanylyltransferase n=1 Tax=Aliamphritea ceti TaxID=1524258 RepID=UPI0021C34C20|nr:bifunctional adenosylcobinamide kinase/adenosylcobinamide-phosphate guanylyltransferase [Aliamphritea ceti]
MKQLILGGARSGKTALAEQRAQDWHAAEDGRQVYYLATANAGDGEMSARIQRHQDLRPEGWMTIEEPVDLAAVLAQHNVANTCLLIDCLTLWVTNLLMLEDDARMEASIAEFEAALTNCQAEVIMVSNEVGLGIVPMGELTRKFQDQAGFLHQRLAQICERVTLTVAGLPMEFKA